MTPTPPISRWRRLARGLATLHPPWWGSAWAILLIAVLWYPLTAPLRHSTPSPNLNFWMSLALSDDGTWHLMEREGDAPHAIVIYQMAMDEATMWTRYRLLNSRGLAIRMAASPTLAEAAAAWRAADEQTRAVVMPGVKDSIAPLSLGDLLDAYSTGQPEVMLGQRWYALGIEALRLPPVLFLVALVLGVTRTIRRRALARAAETIKANLCARCRYSLEGLAPYSACPECGANNEAIRKDALAELGPLPR